MDRARGDAHTEKEDGECEIKLTYIYNIIPTGRAMNIKR